MSEVPERLRLYLRRGIPQAWHIGRSVGPWAAATGLLAALAVPMLAACGTEPSVAPPVDRNLPPEISLAEAVVHHNDTYIAWVEAWDPDGDSVTVRAVSLPPWLAFDAGTRRVQGLPGEENIGLHEMVFEASDGRLSVTDTVRITVLLAPCLERAIFGDPALSPYVLPFPVGDTAQVIQTYCGVGGFGSHTIDNQLAYDFRTEFGAPVAAARAGRVIEAVEHWPDTDKNGSHFNFLLVRHDDGTFAFYAHLQQYGFLVEVGDTVSQGEVLAAGGESGTPTLCAAFGECAVLHFGVYRASWAVDIPVEFRNADGPLDARGGLQTGVSYTALPY